MRAPPACETACFEASVVDIGGRSVAVVVAGSGGVFFAGVMLLPALSGDDEAGGALIAIGMGILACAWAAWATAKKLVASVNVEHIGEDRGGLS